MNRLSLKIRREFIVIFKFILAFGFWRWMILYIKFKQRTTQKFKVPGIKYPFKLRNEPSDRKVFYQLFVDGEPNYLEHTGNSYIIIDGGANIGLNAIIYKNKYPDSKIICVEPDDQNIQALKENISPYDGIFVEQAGLWNRNAQLKVYDKYGLGKSGIIVEEVSENGNVSGITITSLMRKYELKGIDLLKLDIEASEKYLFADNYSDWLPHIKVILIELHDRMAEGCSKAFFEAINKSFESYKLSQHGEYIMIVNSNMDYKS